MKKYLITLAALALLVGTTSLVSAADTQPTATKKVVKKTVKAKKVVKKPVKKTVKAPAKPAKKVTPQAKTPETKTPVPASTTTPKPEVAAKKTHAVDIKDFAFAPSELKIKVGDTVVFTQRDATIHTVDTDPHPTHTQLPGFVSGSLAQGQSYSHTFTKAGTFTYHCSPHPNMMAKIIVEE